MPLITRTSTPAKIAANQANGRLSRGPATAEGKERIRDANTRHGFYSRAPGESLRILGEDPEDFQRLLDSLTATWQPADKFQKRLVERLARAMLRMERGDRVQESMAVRHLEWMDKYRDHSAGASQAEFETRLASLNKLMDAVAHANYATGFEELLTFDSL